jgi:hypothetical protein
MSAEIIEHKHENGNVYHTTVIYDAIGTTLPILSIIEQYQRTIPPAHIIHVICTVDQIHPFPDFVDTKTNTYLDKPIHHSEKSKQINWDRVAVYVNTPEDCAQCVQQIKESVKQLPAPPINTWKLRDIPNPTPETPFDKRSCYDCCHIRAACSLWCGNTKARKARGTSIPGCIHCPYWGPAWKMITKEYRTAEYGYVSKWQKFKKFLYNLL